MMRERRTRARCPLSVWSTALFLAIVALHLWTLSTLRSQGPLSMHGVDRGSFPVFPFVNKEGRSTDIALDIDRLCASLTGLHSPCRNLSTAWSDWKPCIQDQLGSYGWPALSHSQYGASFADFMFWCKDHLPWTVQSKYTAVLLEFRPMERSMRFAVDNVMNNLPVDWRIQIVGGPSVCELAFDLYGAEVAAQKAIITLLGHENVEQVSLFTPLP